MLQYCFVAVFEVLKRKTQTKEVFCTQYQTCLMLQYLCFVFEVLKGETQTKEGVPVLDMPYAAISLLYV